MPQGRAQLFIPITKVDLEKREVWGVAAEERTDKTGREKFDYAESKPLFQDWIADFETRTGGKSKGNIREMHQPSAVGKAIAWDFDDAAKTIRVGAKVVDDAAWAKVQEGVLTGFSIGGSYARVWDDPDEPGVKRYAARPVETSLVDNPCMYGATFEVIRADGATELRKFARTEARMDAALIGRVEAAKAALVAFDPAREVRKGLYTVGRLADILDQLRGLLSWERTENAAEGGEPDEAPAVARLQEGIATLADAFAQLAAAEAAELTGAGEDESADDALGGMGDLLMAAVGDLTKMDPAAARKVLKRVQQLHDIAKGWGAACASAEKVTKAAEGDAVATDGTQADTTAEEDDMKPEDITKAVADALGGVEKSVAGAVEKALAPVTGEVEKAAAAIAELKKTVETQAADIAALKAQPAAAPGVAKPGVAREDDGAAKSAAPDPATATPLELAKFALRPENAAHITRPAAA